MSFPPEHKDQLPHYDQAMMLDWLTAPVTEADRHNRVNPLARQLALAARLHGTEVKADVREDHIHRIWHLAIKKPGDVTAALFTLDYNCTYAGEYPARRGIYARWDLKLDDYEQDAARPDRLVVSSESRNFEFGQTSPKDAFGSASSIRNMQAVQAFNTNLLGAKGERIPALIAKARASLG